MTPYPRPIALRPDFVRDHIDAHEDRHMPNRVQHGHPGPGNWTPLERSAESMLQERLDSPRSAVNLYVGSPFCVPTVPARCGFCLFPTEEFEGKSQLEAYLAVLRREFRLLERYYGDDRLASIYFGGGTPNLYRPEQYATLMSYVEGLYGPVPDDIEVTMEGLPPLFSADKIRAMADVGVNRISMGAQQIDEELVKFSGRHQTRAHVSRAIALGKAHGMNVNIDLIYGWPNQTVKHMLHDLAFAVDEGVDHIAHYRLNVGGRVAFTKKAMRELQPSIPECMEMYRESREFLLAAGFEQTTVYDWKRVPTDDANPRLGNYDYEQSMHHFDRGDADLAESDDAPRQVCGIGCSAISFHTRSMARAQSSKWMNTTSTRDYAARLHRGELPVERGFVHAPDDIRIDWLYQAMQTMKIDTQRYRALFGHEFGSVYHHFVAELVDRGWAVEHPGSLHFTDDGQYHVPLLQACIATPRMEELVRGARKPLERIAVVAEVA